MPRVDCTLCKSPSCTDGRSLDLSLPKAVFGTELIDGLSTFVPCTASQKLRRKLNFGTTNATRMFVAACALNGKARHRSRFSSCCHSCHRYQTAVCRSPSRLSHHISTPRASCAEALKAGGTYNANDFWCCARL